MTHEALNRTLGDTNNAFADDDGSASQRLRELLAAAASGEQEPYLDAIVEMCLSRLLLPVVAAGDNLQPEGPVPDRHAEMSAVMLQRPDGTKALIAFTGTDSLAAWDRQARPIPATLDRVAEATVMSGAQFLIIDLNGPHTLMIQEPLLTSLGKGQRLVRLADGGYGWLATHPDHAAEPKLHGGGHCD